MVCKAEDTELHHFVAPKFLREHLAHNDQLLERFGREAQAALRAIIPTYAQIHAGRVSCD